MEQLRVTLDRITRIVDAEGGTPGDIVKITTYVISIADWRANASEQQSLFNEFFKGEYPANTLVEITALAEPGLDVEIEAIAELG
jgi:enamine deaminase RidA (YjgF/YER057c/UK114 family)